VERAVGGQMYAQWGREGSGSGLLCVWHWDGQCEDDEGEEQGSQW
jgi:hypothetical protein